ncbi:MAG TPA: T9SS type A sorting domain-containing protein [Crocinitomicaceae bacterium]|nr:T9SS type A sorting domain-containing protein [Crocinitomicaceae bacterium]
MKQQYILIVYLFFSAFSFSQTENYWTRMSDFGTDTTANGLKRERAVGFSIGNYGYIGTGIDTAEIVHDDFWKFDPVTNAWTQVATLPASVRRNAVSFSTENYGYVGTGISTVNSSDVGSQILNDFWQYNPTANSWLQKANYPGGGSGGNVYFATAFSIDSKGYVCGGKMGPNNYSNQLWEYKESIDQWTQLPNFPDGGRYQMASFSIGFKGYVGLGADQDLYNNDFWEFNAATNQWTQISSLPSSVRAASATFSIGPRGFVCMGTNGGALDDLWEYNPYSDSWTARANFGGSSRKSAVGFSINGKGYVGTGKGNSGKKASFYQYTPAQVVSVDELQNEISVYPNPISDVLNITTNSTEIKELAIFSLSGELVMKSNFTNKIFVESINSGVYLLFAINENGDVLSQQKIIKL